MGEMSEMMLGASANDLFCKDFQSKRTSNRYVSGVGEPYYLPTKPTLADLFEGELPYYYDDERDD